MSAHAADGPTAAQVEAAKEHFGKGRELYEKGDKKAAVAEFKQAYKLSRNALLLYNIGLVYDELGDRSLAISYYGKFLKEAPDSERTRENKKLAKERVAKLEAELLDDEDAPAKPTPPPPPKKPAITAFTHTIVDEAPPEQPIDIAVLVPTDSGWIPTLYYRVQGQDAFVAVQMKPRFEELVGRVPGEAVKGPSIQYYVEAKDKGGKVVAQSGSPASPNIIFLEKGAKPHFYREEDVPVAEAEVPTPVETAAGGAGLDDEDPFADDDAPGARDAVAAPSYAGSESGIRPVTYLTTAGAALLLGASGFFFYTAGNYARALEDESEYCGNPPCSTFDAYSQDLESTGQLYETLSTVAFATGVVATGVAGYFWYKDLTRKPRRFEAASKAAEEQARRGISFVGAAPVVAPGVIGGAAVVRF
jgi:hypothetical protein